MSEFLSFDFPMKYGQPLFLTPFGDTHLDAGDCDKDAVLRCLKERSKIPNHYFVGIGDTFNLIYGHDFRASIKHARDEYMKSEYLNNLLDIAGKELMPEGIKWLAMGMGNHESSLIKRFGINITKLFCEKFDIPFAGYSGVFRLNFKQGDGKNKAVHQIRWHHGGDGGAVTRGMPWANRYFSGFEGDSTCWFGHVHHHWMMMVPKTSYSERGKRVMRSQHIVCCGTGQESQQEGGCSWSEVKGFPPTAHGYFPMTILTPRRDGIKQVTCIGDIEYGVFHD